MIFYFKGREKKIQVFEKKILRKILGPKRDEQTGKWRILQNVELHNLYVECDYNKNA